MTSRKPSVTGSKETKDKCPTCEVKVGSKDNALQCEICEYWWHSKCEGISDEGYKALQGENVHWFCIQCNKGVGRIWTALSKLEDRQVKLEEEVKAVRNGMESLRKDVENKMDSSMESLRRDLQNKMDSVTEAVLHKVDKNSQATIDQKLDIWATKLEADIQSAKQKVDDKIDAKLTSVASEVESMNRAVDNARTIAAEEQDREMRRCNVILYRVPESEADNETERKVHDKRFCMQFMHNLNIGVAEDDIKRMNRIGRLQDRSTPRPIVIEFGNKLVKNLMMESLYKIKHMDRKFKSIIVAHDMTRKEREDCKSMVAEAKSKTDADSSGEWIYLVRGPPGKMIIKKFRRTRNLPIM